jgi:hypothetical protein
MKDESVEVLRARRDAKLRDLAKAGPLICGSLAKVKVRCGNPNCRCATGERHEATILCKKVNGRSTSVHVPREMAEEVARWSAEHRRLKRLMKEVSDLGERMIRLHVRTERARRRNVPAGSKTSPG